MSLAAFRYFPHDYQANVDALEEDIQNYNYCTSEVTRSFVEVCLKTHTLLHPGFVWARNLTSSCRVCKFKYIW